MFLVINQFYSAGHNDRHLNINKSRAKFSKQVVTGEKEM